MSMLTVCQNVASFVSGLTYPTTVQGLTDLTSRRLITAARYAALDIKRTKLKAMLRVGQLNITSGNSEYAEPADVYSYVSDTFWTSTDRFAAGPVDPQTFQRLLENGTVTVDPIHRFKRNDASSAVIRVLEVYPTPTDNYDINFLYWSNHWLKDAAGTTGKADWTLDTDVPVIEEELVELGMIWLVLRSMRRDYGEELKMYQDYRDARKGDDIVARIIDLTNKVHPPIANTPEAGFG